MDLTWLKTLAPTVASALGGPLAGLAVAAVGKAFGIDDATQESITAALADGKLTGDQVLALKQAEITLKEHEEEIGFKFADLEVADRKDARAMQIATRSAVPAILTLVITIGFFGILIGMMAGKLHVDDTQVLLMMLGSLSTGWAAALAYWLGTTHNSAEKTALIARSKEQ